MLHVIHAYDPSLNILLGDKGVLAEQLAEDLKGRIHQSEGRRVIVPAQCIIANRHLHQTVPACVGRLAHVIGADGQRDKVRGDWIIVLMMPKLSVTVLNVRV